MESSDALYRLRLAAGFLQEGRDQLAHGLHRAAVDAAQLSVENSVKAVLALFGPVPKVHRIAASLESLMAEEDFDEDEKGTLARLTELAATLGFETHVRTDYGDELQGLTPWDLYDEEEARKALAYAEEAHGIARRIVEQRV